MLILHPRDQPPIGGAYQPADWDAPLADDPFFSLSLSSLLREREEENETRRENETPQTANVRSFDNYASGGDPFQPRPKNVRQQSPNPTFNVRSIESHRNESIPSRRSRSVPFSSVPFRCSSRVP